MTPLATAAIILRVPMPLEGGGCSWPTLLRKDMLYALPFTPPAMVPPPAIMLLAEVLIRDSYLFTGIVYSYSY